MNITLQNISKAFGGKDILKDFSLDLDAGTRLCVCGPNGTGKSTLLRIVAGADAPDAGRVLLPRGCRLGYVEQDFDEATLDIPLLEFVQATLPDWNAFWADWDAATTKQDNNAISSLMARQAELEAVYGYNPEHRARAVLSGLGFKERKWGRSLRQFSGGWRERAKLARILTAGADLLLLDEPTNHLDIEAVEWLESFLLSFKGVLVFVAHDRIFMDRIGTHVLYMGGAKPVFRKATFTQFLTFQEELEGQRAREAKAVNDEIARKMAFVERFRAKATKARQAGSRQKMAKKLEKELEQLQPEQRRKELRFAWPESARTEKTVCSAVDVAFAFADNGRTLWPPLSFTLYRGQRVALVGPNGCGKSTLLRVLAGRLEKTGGSLVTGSLVRMGFFSQHHTDTLNPQGNVLGEIRRLSDPRTTEEELMSVLGLFLLGQNYFERRVDTLSGGEKSRLLLATLFLARCNFLVLDEPTNHLDLESREALIEALDAFDGTVLMVAHDRWLLSAVAQEAWGLSQDGITVYDGGYEAYEAARRDALATVNSAQTGAIDTAQGLSREEQKRQKRLEAEQRNALHKQRKPLQDAYIAKEKELEDSLAEQASIESQLADPAVYADGTQATALLRRFNELREETERLFEELAAMEARLVAMGG